MIKNNFKIILFNGGFAGDLITGLHNPDTFKGFDNNTVVLDDQVLKLKSYEFRQNNSFDEKIEYLKSIEDIGVCSSHDQELALRLKENTVLVHCSDARLVELLYNRIERDKDDMKMTLEEHMNWQEANKKVFKNQIDISNISNADFLDNLGINDVRSVVMLRQWIALHAFGK